MSRTKQNKTKEQQKQNTFDKRKDRQMMFTLVNEILGL